MRLRALSSLLFVTVLAASLLRPPFSSGEAWPQGPQAKPPAGTQEPQQPIRVGVSLVNLYATVRDKHKRIISDLTQDDFRIYEDSQAQKVAFFSHETSLPITLGLLIDTSGSEQRMLPAEQEAASRFLARVLRKGDLAMVVSFDLDVDLLSDFTSDLTQLESAIHRARINAPRTGDRRAKRKKARGSFRPDLRRAAHPIRPGLLPHEHGPRRPLPQDQDRKHARWPPRACAQGLLRSEELASPSGFWPSAAARSCRSQSSI